MEFGPEVTSSDKSMKVMLNSQDKVGRALMLEEEPSAADLFNVCDSRVFRRSSTKSETSISPTSLASSVRKPGISRLLMM